MANNIILVLGIIQIVAGIVLLGLFSADYHANIEPATKIAGHKISGSTDQKKAEYFGPILVGILVAVNGIIGIIAGCAGKAFFDVLYLMGTAIGATASSTLVWIYAIKVSNCVERLFPCSDKSNNIQGATLAFSSLACIVSVIGMVVLGLQMCKK